MSGCWDRRLPLWSQCPESLGNTFSFPVLVYVLSSIPWVRGHSLLTRLPGSLLVLLQTRLHAAAGTRGTLSCTSDQVTTHFNTCHSSFCLWAKAPAPQVHNLGLLRAGSCLTCQPHFCHPPLPPLCTVSILHCPSSPNLLAFPPLCLCPWLSLCLDCHLPPIPQVIW